MKKAIITLALFGLVAITSVALAQTHYTGIANVIHLLDDCTGHHEDSAIHEISYSVIPRKGNTDSISFAISISIAYNSAVFVTKRVYPLDGFAGTPTTDTITYLRNDADSIIFSFRLHYNFSEHNPSVPLTDPCRDFNDDEYFNGIARISTLTAGVGPQAQGVSAAAFFPNPTNGPVKIKGVTSRVSLIDNLGRISMIRKIEGSVEDESNTIDISSLPSGCYTLVIEQGENRRIGKLIKF
ncbi:MAG: T9SS type A sorting domain-containing protein [Bacteroidota bacterium]|nr:T9SS type A sorting domain-containing protein [Bacteroidota bacterium]MDP4229494.1 T9SS type A sorting domain-containing protein [Bacteroidota bacterium]MDP4236153.1 T9SS type A sorting domain-containing protein [Bacteroidota bacterium]